MVAGARRSVGQYGLLREVAGRAEAGGEGWCAVQQWLRVAAVFSADGAGALEASTCLRMRPRARGPSRALADGLSGRALALVNMGQAAEAAGEARRALAVVREVGYPAGEVLALGILSFAAGWSDDLAGAVQLARQATQVTVGASGHIARWSSYVLDRRPDRGRRHGRRRRHLRGGRWPAPGTPAT